MQPTSTSFLELISKALRADYNQVANEPLPERWVDLIHHLNERERAEADRHRRGKPRKGAPTH